MSPNDFGFLVYAPRINVFKCFEGLRLVLARAHWHALYTQAQNLTDVP